MLSGGGIKEPVNSGTGVRKGLVWVCLVGKSHDYGSRPKAGSAFSVMGLRRDTTSLRIGQKTLIKGRRRDLTTSTESRKGALTYLRGEQQEVWTFVRM